MEKKWNYENWLLRLCVVNEVNKVNVAGSLIGRAVIIYNFFANWII